MKYKICKTHFFLLHLCLKDITERSKITRAYRIIIYSNYNEIYKYFYQIGQI